MNQLLPITRKFFTGRTVRSVIADIAAYLFVFLFIYTASSKLMDLDSFRNVLTHSVLLQNIAPTVTYGIPFAEIGIAIILIIPKLQRTGLFLSLLLMLVFTGYLTYMVIFSSERTCNCGGVISSLSWQQHIWFNIAFIIMAVTGIQMKKSLIH